MPGYIFVLGIIIAFILIAVGISLIFKHLNSRWLIDNNKPSFKNFASNSGNLIQRIFKAPEQHTNLMMIIAVLLIITPLYLIPFDRIDVYGGVGWDGSVYAKGTADFYNMFRHDQDKMIGRLFPPGFIHHVFILFRLPITTDNIILAYSFANIFCVFGIVYFWGLLADELRISWRGKWLGLTGLIINYLVIKQFSYYPVHTDLVGYLLAIIMLTLYIKRRTASVYLIMLIGAFTHPILIYLGGILTIFPREERRYYPVGNRKAFAIVLGLITSCLALVYIIINLPLVTNQNYRWAYNQLSSYIDIEVLLNALLPYGIVIILFHLFIGIYHLTKDGLLFEFQEYLDYRLLIRFTGVGFSIWAILYFQNHFSDVPPISSEAFLAQLFNLGLVHPGVFYIAHVLWFGPLVLFVYILWIPISQTIGRYGKGLIISAVLGVIFCVISASRRIDPFYAFFLPFTIKVIDQLNWTNKKYWLIIGLSLIYSRIWLIIGSVQTDWGVYKYSMNRGNYMSFLSYLFFIIVVGLTAYFIYDFILEKNLFPWNSKIRATSLGYFEKIGYLINQSLSARVILFGFLLIFTIGFIYFGNQFMDTTMRYLIGK